MCKKYDAMYIVKPINGEKIREVILKFKNLITSNGGNVEKTACFGKRRLLYEIQDFDEDVYFTNFSITFTAEDACVTELNRVTRISDEVLQYIIIRKNEYDEIEAEVDSF